MSKLWCAQIRPTRNLWEKLCLNQSISWELAAFVRQRFVTYPSFRTMASLKCLTVADCQQWLYYPSSLSCVASFNGNAGTQQRNDGCIQHGDDPLFSLFKTRLLFTGTMELITAKQWRMTLYKGVFFRLQVNNYTIIVCSRCSKVFCLFQTYYFIFTLTWR